MDQQQKNEKRKSKKEISPPGKFPSFGGLTEEAD
jgi:hypothetical protein